MALCHYTDVNGIINRIFPLERYSLQQSRVMMKIVTTQGITCAFVNRYHVTSGTQMVDSATTTALPWPRSETRMIRKTIKSKVLNQQRNDSP